MSTSVLKPIKLYTAATMNGYKASIILEELGIPYTVHYLDFNKKEQKQGWYLKINPNGRIPAIIDPNNNNYALAESAAILMYLCEKYDPKNIKKLYPYNDVNKKYKIIQWLSFQISGIGPAMGNCMYYHRIVEPKGIQCDYSKKRFKDESKRLLSIIDNELKESNNNGYDYILGKDYTIVDIIHYPYVKSAFWATISLDNYKYIQKWLGIIDQRKAVIKALKIPKERPEFWGNVSENDMKKAIENNAAGFKDQLNREMNNNDNNESKEADVEINDGNPQN